MTVLTMTCRSLSYGFVVYLANFTSLIYEDLFVYFTVKVIVLIQNNNIVLVLKITVSNQNKQNNKITN